MTMSHPGKTQTAALANTRFAAGLERRVFDYIRKHNVFTPAERVLVGVSGGPDSTALLVILSRLRPKLAIDITAAHFDHKLRTHEEADEDARFATDIAAALGVPLVSSSADVRASASRNHHSLEDAARRLRYAFFADEAASTGASCVSVGHTLDDQAETVLLHLIRGSGIDGLAGMRPRARWTFGPGPDLVRPLLSIRRSDTERYCRERGIEPRSDPTNRLPIAARNRLRHELLPVLRRFNPRIEEAIARLSDVAASESGYLEELANSCFPEIASVSPAGVTMTRRDLLAARPAMSRRLIRIALEQASGHAADVEALHVETLLDALEKPPGSYSLPGGLTATTDQYSLVVHRGPGPPAAQGIPETKLSIPGQATAGGWTISAEVCSVPPHVTNVGPDEVYLDLASTGRELTVRARRPGDRLRPLGLGGEKKLQDILVDSKVPAAERDGVPLICGPDGIIWVAGYCIDERYALHIDSRHALHLSASPLAHNKNPSRLR
jgi:tRNA(Ile)-lysidine synthase